MSPGEIHGLIGENGAGKTTLARILGGLVAPDSGRVRIGGRAVELSGARQARALGVAMVHQHFSLVPSFTGLENVALLDPAAWNRRGAAARSYRERVEARARELRLAVELDQPVGGLGVGARQRIEVLKALMPDPRVLLLDEPTAVLAPQEVDGLLAVLRRVADAGGTVVLVAHKLDEVLAVATRVTVLRRGRRVLTTEVAGTSAPELAEAMVGAEVAGPATSSRGRGPPLEATPVASSPWIFSPEHREGRCAGLARRFAARMAALFVQEATQSEALQRGCSAPRMPGEVCPRAARLVGVHARREGGQALRGLSLEVRRGEIVGIAGVDGNGQRTLAAVLAGVQRPDEGEAELPREVGWIPQDRTEEGLVGEFAITENVALALHGRPALRSGPWLDWRGVGEATLGVMREMEVQAEGARVAASALSGGNQQRVVVGRELLRSGSLLVAESPTRGLDVKAAAAVRARIRELAASGDEAPGVVLISTDLDEVLELADRTLVLVRGRLVEIAPGERTHRAIGRAMLGAD